MLIKFYVVISLFNFVISKTEGHDCNYLQNDYDSLYNTSLELYTECTKQSDEFMNLYENEIEVTDILMEKLQECEKATSNLSNSVNYTTLVMSKRENIELEASLLALKKQITKYEEKQNLELLIISDYKDRILTLQNNITRLTNEIYLINGELSECHGNWEAQSKSYESIFENLN